jgi:hypothetical protein
VSLAAVGGRRHAIIEYVNRRIAVAFWLTILGGVVLALGSVLSLPLPILVLALIAFLAGTALVVCLAGMDARRTGQALRTSAWSGIRTGLRWLWAFMP